MLDLFFAAKLSPSRRRELRRRQAALAEAIDTGTKLFREAALARMASGKQMAELLQSAPNETSGLFPRRLPVK